MRALFAAGIALVLADAAAFGEELLPLETVEIAPGNFVHYGRHEERSAANLGDNANIGFIVGSRCVLVVDTGGSRALGERLRAAVRRVTQTPVCYLVITHVHPDHFFGASAFAADDPEVIGHENLPRQLAARARPYLNSLKRDLREAAQGSEIVPPTRTVKTSKTTEIDLGGRVVEVKAWPPAHTDNDLTLLDRKTGTLWLGDLLFVQHTPVLDSNISGFLAVMRELRSLEVARYVPGHGRGSVPWPAALDPQERYFKLILDETRAAIRDRLTLMDALERVGLSEAPNWVNFETYHRRNVTTAYTELEWED
ncbi:MAG: quinoprotein relay system zinc metallohydrolase 2 [Burkholderiales bacterium]